MHIILAVRTGLAKSKLEADHIPISTLPAAVTNWIPGPRIAVLNCSFIFRCAGDTTVQAVFSSCASSFSHVQLSNDIESHIGIIMHKHALIILFQLKAYSVRDKETPANEQWDMLQPATLLFSSCKCPFQKRMCELRTDAALWSTFVWFIDDTWLTNANSLHNYKCLSQLWQILKLYCW